MNVSLIPVTNFLGNSSATEVIQEVNSVVTNDSEAISETIIQSMISVTLMRKNYLRVESLLRPTLISR